MRAKRIFTVNRQFYDEHGIKHVPDPPVEWFVRGPRGGLYEATGEVTVEIETKNMTERDWMTGLDVIYVIHKSEGLRYLRPASATSTHRQILDNATTRPDTE